MKIYGKYFLILFIVIAAASNSGAASTADLMPEMIDARAMALGGATTSVPGPLGSARSNPAGLALERGFFGGATYLNRSKDKLETFSLTVVDNSTAAIAGALQYFRTATDTEMENIGLSLAAGSANQYWGLTGRYVRGKNTKDAEMAGAFVGDVGILFLRDNDLRIGIAARDLFATTFDVLEPRVALGVSYSAKNGVMLTTDFVRNFDQEFSEGHSFGLGLEWVPRQTYFALRGGQIWDAASGTDSYSLGLGWRREGMEAGYAFRQCRQTPGVTIHVFTIGGTF
jgi:hypothetical protein